MTRTTDEVIDRFNRAFRERDATLLEDIIAPDCVMESVQPAPDGTRYEGYDASFSSWEDLIDDTTSHFEVEDVHTGDEWALIRWSYVWGPGPDDSVRGVNVMRAVDGKIVEAAGAEILGDDPVAARAIAARIWDRTPGTAPPIQMANQLGMVFAKLNCKPRWRQRLPEIEVPTLVVHGRRDSFFPVGNGEAIACEVPGARLLVLEEAATAIPDAAAGEIAEAMLALG
jgi:pimeloyl-ACP methyl ester carboxylesterase